MASDKAGPPTGNLKPIEHYSPQHPPEMAAGVAFLPAFTQELKLPNTPPLDTSHLGHPFAVFLISQQLTYLWHANEYFWGYAL